MPQESDRFYTSHEIAQLLGVNAVSVRRWRTKNKAAGALVYGPPYEYRGPNVVYPKRAFTEWCKQVRMVNGVPNINLPVSAKLEHADAA